MEPIILIGYGGHAASVADSIIQANKYSIYGYVDFQPNNKACLPYLGDDNSLEKYFCNGITAAFISVGYIGENKVRKSLYEKLKNIGFSIPAVIDPSAVIAVDAKIGEGSFIGKNAVVNANAQVGKMCIINTGAIIEHDSSIGNYSHISVNSAVCGSVKIGEHCFIGAGSTIIQNITIGNETIIGAGSTVLGDVPDNITAYGTIKKIPF